MTRLIADIGGTNARFALTPAGGGGTADGGPVTIAHERHLKVRDHSDLASAARAYLADLPDGPAGISPAEVSEAVIAVATPVDAEVIRFTNSPWTFTRPALARDLGVARLAVINDFAAQAAAIPHLQASDWQPIGGGTPRPDWPIAVIGPGTGLGAAGLVPTAAGPVIVASEGGHVSFAPNDAQELAILGLLLERHEHVSNERLISGPGLATLARTLAAISGRPFTGSTPEAVTEAAAAGTSGVASEALALFSGLLGAAAGDLALTLGAKGGVYICGGLCAKLGRFLDHQRFRQRFEAKGRLAAFLADVPCRLVTNPQTGLIGTAVQRLAP